MPAAIFARCSAASAFVATTILDGVWNVLAPGNQVAVSASQNTGMQHADPSWWQRTA